MQLLTLYVEVKCECYEASLPDSNFVLWREVRSHFEKEQNYGLHVGFGSYIELIASAQ